MSRALLFLVSAIFCISLSACSTKKDVKDGDQASADKKHDNDHDGDDHKKHDPHAPSEEPLKIVDDIVEASDHATQLFANDHARVIEMELHKGEKLPLHTGGPRVVFAVTDLDIQFTEVHGGDHTHDHKEKFTAGQVHSHGAGAHGVANLSEQDAEFVVFLRKSGDAFDAAVPAGAQVLTEATKFATRLEDNDDFRVIKVALPRGEKISKHFMLNRLIYALEDFKATYTGAEGKTEDRTMKKGEVLFRPAGFGMLESSGESMAMFLVIEMKR